MFHRIRNWVRFPNTAQLTRLVVLMMAMGLTMSLTELRQVSAWQTDVPLDQALVLEGGESTNPRSFDPATTLTGGDKRVFSGLVSLNPSLNVIPDLAERWDVGPDGTLYTFSLRQNARFHDGRPVTAQDVVYSWDAPRTRSGV